MKTKICSKCKIEKPLKEFSKDKSRKDRHIYYCKECVEKYGKEYRKNNKEKIYIRTKNWQQENRQKCRQYGETYREKHKEELQERRNKNKLQNRKRAKKHYEANKEYYRTKKIRNLKLKPWRKHFESANQRCNNPNAKSYKVYGGRGIKCLMSAKDFKFLWFRDKAYELEYPSIDRKNNDGNYTLKNCQFIEFSENVRKAQLRTKK